MTHSKESMTRAAVKLLRQSGLSGAGINQVIAESGAPKGSLYYYFPHGKSDLVEAALATFGAAVRENLTSTFSKEGNAHSKLLALFSATAERLKANRFQQGCAVAAVVLDLDDESAGFATTCSQMFQGWREAIAAGLSDIDAKDRENYAEFVLAALEGALILSRAKRSTEPLMKVAKVLVQLFQMKKTRSAK